MALPERTTPPTPNPSPVSEKGKIILLSPPIYSTRTRRVRLEQVGDTGVFIAIADSPTIPVFSFDPLIVEMQARGIKDPMSDPSWKEETYKYVRRPYIQQILEQNGLD